MTRPTQFTNHDNFAEPPPGFRIFPHVLYRGPRFFIPMTVIDQIAADAEAESAAAVADDLLRDEVALVQKKAERDLEAAQAEVVLPKRPSLPIFDIAKIDSALNELPPGDREKSTLASTSLLAARRDEGERLALPARTTLSAALSNLSLLESAMPNFAVAIDALAVELALALAGDLDSFHVTPILLHGGAGVGKTLFATQLAECFNVPFEKISMGSASGNFELGGASRGWSTARPGRIAKLLANGEDASPVVLLDEIDKLGSDQRYPVEPVLLDLLEPNSAKNFRDEFLEVTLDASRIIFIATANDPEQLSAPLRSRVRMIEIQPPTAAQRRGIVSRLADQYRHTYGIEFLPEAEAVLSDPDFDLRRLQQVLRDAAGRALMQGRAVCPDDFLLPDKKLQRMGFV